MNRGLIMGPDGQKMSKRWGNVVDPGEEVLRVGADAVRMYLAFIGPYNETGAYPWNPGGIAGVRRFLEKVWGLADKVSEVQLDAQTETLLHQTTDKVSRDIESLKMNTAVSALMILTNHLSGLSSVSKNTYKILLQLLAPFAPHLAHELAERAGFLREEWERWPTVDESKLRAATVQIAVQVNGKTRGSVELATSATQEEALAAARHLPAVAKWLASGTEARALYVPGKIISFVVQSN
jgi:leucyl-tRNA synthetase